MAQSKVRIEFAGNPGLREVFSRKQPGDTCVVEAEFQIASIQPEYVEGDLLSIGCEDGAGGVESPPEVAETTPEQPSEIQPTGTEPAVMLVLRGAGKK